MHRNFNKTLIKASHKKFALTFGKKFNEITDIILLHILGIYIESYVYTYTKMRSYLKGQPLADKIA